MPRPRPTPRPMFLVVSLLFESVLCSSVGSASSSPSEGPLVAVSVSCGGALVRVGSVEVVEATATTVFLLVVVLVVSAVSVGSGSPVVVMVMKLADGSVCYKIRKFVSLRIDGDLGLTLRAHWPFGALNSVEHLAVNSLFGSPPRSSISPRTQHAKILRSTDDRQRQS